MPTYTVSFYEDTPGGYGFPNVGTHTYTGPATPTGTATITDNGVGLAGETLEAAGQGETATGDVTINGLTSIGTAVYALRSYTLRDTVTLEEFQIVHFVVVGGDAAGDYTLSELPLVPGRTYETLEFDMQPNAETGDPVFTYAEQVCYAPGTLIDTPEGPRAVETLRPGDLVETLDHGPHAIRWTSCRTHPLEDADTDAKPVQIKTGALGRNLPVRDLIVSPQHRILVGGAGHLQQVFASEVFAPAKSLTAVPGIRHMKGKKIITWIHFACDRHEVVTANGCLSESLLLGPMVVNGLSSVERQSVTDIFGPASTPEAALNGPPARECLTVGAVKRQIAKHLKEKGQLLAKEIRNWDRDLAMEKYEAERLREAASLAHSREKALRIA